MVVNHAISTLRRQPRHQSTTLEDIRLSEASAEPRVDLSMDLAEALARLDADDRAVVWLHDVEGYNHKEIAQLFDMTESFSKTRLSRARARLREWLGGWARTTALQAEPSECHQMNTTKPSLAQPS